VCSNAGYIGSERQAVLVISACYLPPRSIPHYHDVTHQLFCYMMSVVQGLVVDEYVIVYLHSGAPQHSMPSLSTFHKFYHMVDHRYVWSSQPAPLYDPFLQAAQTSEGPLYSAPHLLGTSHAQTGPSICEFKVLS
jgi:hypothetical protein